LVDILKDFQVSGISDDSRKVKKGYLFVAIKGETVNGHNFINEAIKKGAVCVVGEADLKIKGATYIKVADSRAALSLLAQAWYGNPSRKLKVIGVTGTDGKTTTANIIYWILKKAGYKVGLISSVSAKIGDKEYDTGFHVTNPEPLPLQKFLKKMVDLKSEYAVLEVTSHGLDQKRVFGMDFEISVLTNITHEHLDYHKTFDAYLKTKIKLFANSKIAALNKEDSSYNTVRKLLPNSVKVIPYGLDSLAGDVRNAVLTRFPEKYNQLNSSAAITAAKLVGVNEEQLIQSIKSFPQVPGRMEKIPNTKGIGIYVDFAHTPNALASVLASLKNSTKGKLIAVFGCAGERDSKKRPMMAEISTRLADVSIFTAEDPRSEDINKIIVQMVKGVVSYKAKEIGTNNLHDIYHVSGKHCLIRIPERGEAIFYAINKVAKIGDTVVICGKGHEKSMAYDHTEYPWSDYEAVKMALKKIHFTPKAKVHFTPKAKVHFMGILGSGVAGVAFLATKFGYKVTGCDLEKEGHNIKHLKDVDLVVATPAVFYQSEHHPEIVEAQKRGIFLTWQEFLGKHLLKDKKVIAIAGTHGKSTTTAMAGKLLEDNGFDPIVVLGAKVPKWGGNARFGKGEYAVVEADEFNNNFLNYNPEIAVINNIEFDHPDFFKDESEVRESFKKFTRRLTGRKILITEKDSLHKKFNLKVLGTHNQKNANMVYLLGRVLGIDESKIIQSLESFEGIGRRMELISDKNGIKVYDDYAHHPTAIKATLSGLRDKYPGARIWAVVEAHGYARTKALLDKYAGVFDKADFVVVGPIFRARDSQTFGITEKSIAESSKHKNIFDFGDLDKMLTFLQKNLKAKDVVLVMGAGRSNIWAQKISEI